ncbi:hypothetical protein [Marinobacter nauticus]|uniref:hypothetical protein n=1 Tax=Marinobacter nauticus TaxID=2743 RepID=UPI002431A861|nr:hypothetical protein [Marinobacter nauticus]
MMMTVLLKGLLVWGGILVLAIANGVLREAVLEPAFGRSVALVLSGILLSLLIIGMAYVALPWLNVRHLAGLFGLGAAWLVLTLVFEFSFGLWQGKSWAELLEAYTFRGGNLWPIVLAVTVFAPYLAARLRQLL